MPAKAFKAAAPAEASDVDTITGTSGAFWATRFARASSLPASPESLDITMASTLRSWPTLFISDSTTSFILASWAEASSVSFISTAMAQGLTNFFSCLKSTVSSPIFTALSPAPRVMGLMGGAEASPSLAFASSDTSGHRSRDACLWASFIAKARHVGNPHFLQFVFGKSLNISTPVSAIY